MLLRELDYARPDSVDDAVKLLAAQEDARALAGGQSLVNVMKTRVASPELVVDLNRIEALRGIREDDGALTIGAMTTYAAIVGSPEVAAARPILAEVARTIADVQVRNRGTIGGKVSAERPDQPLPAAARRAPGRVRRSAAQRSTALRPRTSSSRACSPPPSIPGSS